MNKLTILMIVLVMLSTGGLAQAEEGKLQTTLDVTYMSKLMDKGGEYYGQQGGLLETLDLDLWGTGFGAAIGHREATSSGYVNKERLDYKLYYGSSLLDGEAYKTDYKLNWIYHHFPDQARNVGNYQEWEFAFSWPDLLPGELVPSYVACYEYPAGSNYGNRGSTGWWHLFGLGYKLDIAELPNPLDISAHLGYRDGLGGGAVDHDWSHATLGISTAFELAENLTFVPGLYHQISMDDSVTKGDVTYVALSLKLAF
jgi:hypothetical protein